MESELDVVVEVLAPLIKTPKLSPAFFATLSDYDDSDTDAPSAGQSDQ